MILTDAQRIRVIRAFLGWSSRSFAKRMGVSAGTLTSWERGRATPQGSKRQEMAKLCQEHGLAFSPSGWPFPIADCMIFKENQSA